MLDLWMLARRSTLATWSSTQEVLSLSSAESEYGQRSEMCSCGNRVGQHDFFAGTQSSRTNLDRRCSSTRAGSPQWERRHPSHRNQALLAAAEREKLGAQNRKIRGTVNLDDLMTKHLDGKRLTTLCDLLSMKHISGKPNPLPKLAIDAEYITRASRTLAAITLVR